MSVFEKPNLLSVLIIGFILVVAMVFGYCTMRVSPEYTTFTSEQAGESFVLPFELDSPDRIISLNSDLREISGLELGDENEILCIQDEDGEVFVLDLETEKIASQHRFAKDRDYEGIARVGDVIYVLERDGDLHYFDFSVRTEKYDSEKLETGFSYRNDTEGLCYDAANDQLLVVPKEQNLEAIPERSHLRSVYAYSLGSRNIDPQPVFSVDEYELGQLVYGERTRYTFKPSAIAVHPNNEHIYLLSAVGESLLVVDRNGEIVFLKRLDRSIFPQPEGIIFDREGRLIISTEGQGDRALIGIYNPKIPGERIDTTSTDQ
ncbi:MAG: SdiA-regulated domain-containing protein [Bacteroidota bacterium]